MLTRVAICCGALAIGSIVALSARGANPSAASADENPSLPANVKRFVRECQSLRSGTIAQLEFQLRGLKSGATEVSNRDRSIRATEKELTALRDGKQILVPRLRWPLDQGAIGRAPGDGAHVEEILGPKEMLVTCYFHETVVEVVKGRPVAQRVSVPTIVVVRGIATDEITEGGDTRLERPLEVIETRDYKTESGQSKKIPVLALFDMRRAKGL